MTDLTDEEQLHDENATKEISGSHSHDALTTHKKLGKEETTLRKSNSENFKKKRIQSGDQLISEDESVIKPNKKEIKSPKSDAKSDGKSDGKSLVSNFIFVSIAVAFFAIIGGVHYILLGDYITEKHFYNEQGDFVKKIDMTFKYFPDQYYETKKMVKNVGIEHLNRVFNHNEEDLRPLSFLVAGYAGSEDTLLCFVKNLGKSFTNKEFQIINATNNIDKQTLNTKIKESLNGKQKFVVIRNIEKLSFKTAQLFMAYADSYNDIAKFPQSILVLTTVLPFPFSPETSSRKHDESRVRKHFMETVWHGQGSNDLIAPLWTRIGDGLVLLKKSDKDCKSI